MFLFLASSKGFFEFVNRTKFVLGSVYFKYSVYHSATFIMDSKSLSEDFSVFVKGIKVLVKNSFAKTKKHL